jgi:central kinetochore subunit Mis15/CHL4
LDRRGSGRGGAAAAGWSIYADEKKKESPLDTVPPSPSVSDRGEAVLPKTADGARKRMVSPGAERESRAAKRAKLVAQARFGDSAKLSDDKGVERVDIVIEDPFPDVVEDATSKPYQGDDIREAEADDAEEQIWRQLRRSKGGRRSGIDLALEQEGVTRERDGSAPDEELPGSWRPNVRLTFHGTHVFAGIRQLVEHGIIDGKRMPGWMTGEDGVTIGVVKHGRIRGHRGSGL